MKKEGKMEISMDFSHFGWKQRDLLIHLLKAWNKQGLPEEMNHNEVTPRYCSTKGHVFLTNKRSEIAMMNGGKLEIWFTCSSCGYEGFAKDMRYHDNDDGCQEFLKGIGVLENNDN
jgi:hypothetical protein